MSLTLKQEDAAIAEPQTVTIPPLGLDGMLTVPEGAEAIIVFAHGSGSSRFSPRHARVARSLQEAGFATLLFDLLTQDEAAHRERVFDVELLAGRLVDATRWLGTRGDTRGLTIGYFGASTGAAAALAAAARGLPGVGAVVSRGGRPDLAGPALQHVTIPTLLIVGGRDTQVLALNRHAMADLAGPRALRIVPGAGHLFEEPGTLDAVIAEAEAWFTEHLSPGSAAREG